MLDASYISEQLHFRKAVRKPLFNAKRVTLCVLNILDEQYRIGRPTFTLRRNLHAFITIAAPHSTYRKIPTTLYLQGFDYISTEYPARLLTFSSSEQAVFNSTFYSCVFLRNRVGVKVRGELKWAGATHPVIDELVNQDWHCVCVVLENAEADEKCLTVESWWCCAFVMGFSNGWSCRWGIAKFWLDDSRLVDL